MSTSGASEDVVSASTLGPIGTNKLAGVSTTTFEESDQFTQRSHSSIETVILDTAQAASAVSTSVNEDSAKTAGTSASVYKRIISPEAIRPHPKAGPRKSASASSASALRKRGDTKILTDTPVKRQLEEQFRQRVQKKQKISRNNLAAPSKTQKLKQRRPKPRKESKDSEPCNICQFQFGNADDPRKGEDWLKCLQCFKWFHDSCAQANGILDMGDKFTCIDCIP